MFEKFTEGAIKVIMLSQEEARRMANLGPHLGPQIEGSEDVTNLLRAHSGYDTHDRRSPVR